MRGSYQYRSLRPTVDPCKIYLLACIETQSFPDCCARSLLMHPLPRVGARNGAGDRYSAAVGARLLQNTAHLWLLCAVSIAGLFFT